jgi:hypothetical protein
VEGRRTSAPVSDIVTEARLGPTMVKTLEAKRAIMTEEKIWYLKSYLEK